MAVGLSVSYFWYQIGSEDFFYSFFSTIAYNLEGKIWGSKYPILMKKLYQGEVKWNDLDLAMKELEDISGRLKNISPEKVVWDIEDLSKQPPWGNYISKDITNLSNYFVTSEGDDLIVLLLHAIDKAKELKVSVKVEVL